MGARRRSSPRNRVNDTLSSSAPTELTAISAAQFGSNIREVTCAATMSEPECEDCASQKAKAEERQDRLQLGECSLLYQDWAACVEKSKGQVTACTAQLKAFRECHNQNKTQPDAT